MRSRVTPGVSSTMAARRPVSLLKSMDLPTFGRPTIATKGLGIAQASSLRQSAAGSFSYYGTKRFDLQGTNKNARKQSKTCPGYHPGRGAVRQAERKELILSCFPCGNGITSPRRQEEPRGHCSSRRFLQALCGRRASPHFGQATTPGMESFQWELRLLSRLALETLHLGTAMSDTSLVEELLSQLHIHLSLRQLLQGQRNGDPVSEAGSAQAPVVQVRAAAGAEALAVRPAQAAWSPCSGRTIGGQRSRPDRRMSPSCRRKVLSSASSAPARASAVSTAGPPWAAPGRGVQRGRRSGRQIRVQRGCGDHSPRSVRTPAVLRTVPRAGDGLLTPAGSSRRNRRS